MSSTYMLIESVQWFPMDRKYSHARPPHARMYACMDRIDRVDEPLPSLRIPFHFAVTHPIEFDRIVSDVQSFSMLNREN